MDRNRLMMIGAALAAVIVIAGGFLLGIQPQLKVASTAHASETSVNSQNETLASSLTTLKSQFSKLDSLNAQLGILKESVPVDVSSATFITELNAIASKSHVTVSNIQFSAPAAYAAPVSTLPAATPTATASASPSASASATATAAPTPTASTPVAPTPTTSTLITASNFSDIPVTMEIQGNYTQALSFLQGLRDGKRLVLVTAISVNEQQASSSASGASSSSNASTGSTEPTWTIGGLVYALTDTSTGTSTSQTATSTAAGATTGTSSPDAAAGK